MTEPTSRVASNGDVSLVYESRGDGEPLLLVHGLGYDRAGWGPVVAPLSKRFRVVSFDNRGVGESDAPRGPYSARVLAEDAISVLDDAGIESAHVVGTSLGGMIAQELALGWPARVRRLVLACTTPGGSRAFPLPDRTLRVFARSVSLPEAEAIRSFVANALADETVRRRPELVEEIVAQRIAHPPTQNGWRAQAAAGAAFDAFDRVERIEAPTLVLHGTADNVVDVRNAELLVARIPHARLELVPGLGHLFFWEDPDRFVRLVTAFLA